MSGEFAPLIVLEAEVEQLRTLAYEAWCLIANAHGGVWSEASDGWRQAAERWRGQFHALCGGPDHDEVRPTIDGRRVWIPGIGGPQSVAATDAPDDDVDVLDVLRLIHQQRTRQAEYVNLSWCVECQQDWPCKTIQIIDEARQA